MYVPSKLHVDFSYLPKQLVRYNTGRYLVRPSMSLVDFNRISTCNYMLCTIRYVGSELRNQSTS